MPRRRHKPEEIVAKLRQVEVLTAQGTPVAEAIRSIGVTEATYDRCRSEYGGLKGDQIKRLKELEAENNRLRRAVSDLTLEKLILKEAASGMGRAVHEMLRTREAGDHPARRTVVIAIRDHAFFEQTVLKDLLGKHLLELTRLRSQFLDLVGVGFARRVSSDSRFFPASRKSFDQR